MQTPKNWRQIGATATTVAVLAATMASTPSGAHAEDSQRIVSQVVDDSSGSPYLEVDGKPWNYAFVQNMGTWERLGHQEEFKPNSGNPDPDYPTAHLPLSFTENMYEKTANLNYETISQALLWRDIEVRPGVYDFTVLDAYIGWAKKYGMKIDLAWFGSACQSGSRIPTYSSANNGTGRIVDIGYQYTAPSWFVQDDDGNPIGTYYDLSRGKGRVDYPLITTGPDAEYMKQQEYKAVEAVFAHLAASDPDGTVISIQIENEANTVPNFATRYIQWIDYLASAVKASDYVVATRVNYSGTSYPINTHDFDHIDFAGTDPYSASVSKMRELILNGRSHSSLGHIAENSGSYANTTSLAIATALTGGYYGIWQLSNWFCDGGGGHFNGPHALYSNRDLVGGADQEMYYDWQLGSTPTLTAQGKDIQRLNLGVAELAGVLARARTSDKAGFNVETDNPVENYQATKPVGRYTLGFRTSEAAVALAVVEDQDIYVTSDTSRTASVIATQQPDSATVGRKGENDEWVVLEDRPAVLQPDGTYSIALEAGEALRLRMPVGDRPENLAFTADVTTTSENPAFPAENIKDGDEWSGLKSANGPSFPQSVTLAWDTPQTFNSVQLTGTYALGQSPTSWDIEVSGDGVGGWAKVAESGATQWKTNGNTAERKTVIFTEQRDVRAVRLKIRSANLTWGAYFITEVQVTASPRPLGLQGALTPTDPLPATVLVDDAERPVEWSADAAAKTRSLYGSVVLGGTYQDGDRLARVEAEYEIIPDDLVYFIDSGVPSAHTASAVQWKAVKAHTPNLANDKPDQVAADPTQWGYVKETPGDTVAYSNGSNFDKWISGLYANRKPAIEYRLPLEAGRYTITAGIHEWWETRNMTAAVSFTTAEGETTMIPGEGISIRKDQNLTSSIAFTLPEKATVSYVLDKGSLGKQAIVSWLAVSGKVDSEAPVVSVEAPQPAASGWHTTSPVVTVSASDDSTISKIQYRVNAGGWASYTDPVALADSDSLFEARAVDAAGNQSDPVAWHAKIDTIIPDLKILGGPNGDVPQGTVPPPPVCEAADAGSGLAEGCVISGYSTVPGQHTITAAVSDRAGNVSTATRTYRVVAPAAWSATTIYTAGSRVSLNGALWLATWWTQNQRPGDPNGPWQEISVAPDGTTLWTASRIFDTGNRVVHLGVTFEAKWWTRNQRPGDPNGPWKRVS